MKKYELTENTKIVDGTTLYQIKALIDIFERGVKIGDLGGYIEREDNLSHESTCWVGNNACVWGKACVWGQARVYCNAQVSGKAWIWGNAEVYGRAKVYENAKISDSAKVFDDARVYGFARVYNDAQVLNNTSVGYNVKVFDRTILTGGLWSKNPVFFTGSRDSVSNCDTNQIRIGCYVLTFDEWLEHYEKIGHQNYYTDEQIIEYKLIIDFIININNLL